MSIKKSDMFIEEVKKLAKKKKLGADIFPIPMFKESKEQVYLIFIGELKGGNRQDEK